MLLSVVFLKVKYQLLHIAGAGVCLLGISALAYADITSGKSNKGTVCEIILLCMVRISVMKELHIELMVLSFFFC